MDHAKGFERWLVRRAAAPKTSQDEDYKSFMDAMRGPDASENGRARHLEPGGEDVAENVPDGVVYEQYLDVLSGAAARRQAEATVRQELRDREQEIVRYSRLTDSGALSRSHEHLRDRLEGAGRPGEGS